MRIKDSETKGLDQRLPQQQGARMDADIGRKVSECTDRLGAVERARVDNLDPTRATVGENVGNRRRFRSVVLCDRRSVFAYRRSRMPIQLKPSLRRRRRSRWGLVSSVGCSTTTTRSPRSTWTRRSTSAAPCASRLSSAAPSSDDASDRRRSGPYRPLRLDDGGAGRYFLLRELGQRPSLFEQRIGENFAAQLGSAPSIYAPEMG